MRAIAGKRAVAALCLAAPFAVNAVDFAVPVEASGIATSVKSIRVSCAAFTPDGLTVAQGSQFVAVAAGAVKQTVTLKLDIPLNKVKPGTGYQCAADRAFDVDVTKMNPVPGNYLKPGHISEGMDIKDINLQANSVVKVGGKL